MLSSIICYLQNEDNMVSGRQVGLVHSYVISSCHCVTSICHFERCPKGKITK
ncbi:MAG: hypothetical protein UIH27_08480 [Ruminococcus sp.]|nr:hypothetical protein [Ruminococcus sp.]